MTNFNKQAGNYQFAYIQGGQQTLLDTYVLQKCRSNFVYKVVESTTGFNLDHNFIHRDLFKNGRFSNQLDIMKRESMIKYDKIIHSRVITARQDHIKVIQARKLMRR